MRELASHYSGQSVLITGGAGFIGSNLAIRLVELGAQVSVIDNFMPGGGANRFNLKPVQDRVHLVQADLADVAALQPLVQKAAYVFNLAGALSHIDSMKDPASDLHANCTAHLPLLELLRRENPKAKTLYAATRGQYGRAAQLPVTESAVLESVDANGISKIAGESYHLLYARAHGLFTCSFRLSNTYGPRHQMAHHRQGVFNWFVRRLLDGDKIQIYGQGTQIRDSNYVDDVVDAMLLALVTDGARGEVFNLGGFPVSLKQLGELLVDVHGSGSLEYFEAPAESKGVEIGDYVADISKAKRLLGWLPRVDPREGFTKTLEYYKANREHYWSPRA